MPRSYQALSEGIFKYALIFSLSVHAVLLLQYSRFNMRNFRQLPKNIEVTYYQFKPQAAEPKSGTFQKAMVKNEPQRSSVVSLKTVPQASPFVKDMSKLTEPAEKFKIAIKQMVNTVADAPKRKVSVPMLKSEKITNPIYQSYNHIIRSMIEKRAYANFSNSETGEVYLAFIVLSDGSVKEIHITEEKTKASEYLREISLRSLREASPFPPLPKDLNYSELPLSVLIEYKLED